MLLSGRASSPGSIGGLARRTEPCRSPQRPSAPPGAALQKSRQRFLAYSAHVKERAPVDRSTGDRARVGAAHARLLRLAPRTVAVRAPPNGDPARIHKAPTRARGCSDRASAVPACEMGLVPHVWRGRTRAVAPSTRAVARVAVAEGSGERGMRRVARGPGRAALARADLAHSVRPMPHFPATGYPLRGPDPHATRGGGLIWGGRTP